MPEPIRVAMWSGPRNLSTALMRSWESRPDTAVTDEPLYAAYLDATGLDHPGRADVLASQPTDWRDVATALSGPVPGDNAVWYQKQMAHHIMPHVGREWMDDRSFRHAFLIRDPASVIVSLDRVTPDPSLEDTGFPQQVELFERFRQRDGAVPPVIDTADVLRDPEGILRALCSALHLAFDPAMLAWPPGPRDTDGAWAPHWYDSVWASTGFGPPRDEPPVVPERLRPLVEACQEPYQALARWRLGTADDGPQTTDSSS